MDLSGLITALVKVFVLILLGFFLNRKKILDSHINSGISALIVCVSNPALIIASLCHTDPLAKGSILRLLFLGIGIYIILPILALLLVRLFRIPREKTGAVSLLLIFANTGFMAIPVLQPLYGEVFAFYSAILNLPFNILIYSYGLYLLTKDKGGAFGFSWKKVITPGIIASILAIIIYFGSIPIPNVMVDCLSFIGNVTPPLSMLLLGSILAEYPLKGLFTDLRLNLLMALKLFLLPLLFFPLAYWVFDGNPIMTGVVTMTFAMPAGSLSAMLCKQYDGDTKTASVGVVFSTVLSMFTIPIVYLIISFFL